MNQQLRTSYWMPAAAAVISALLYSFLLRMAKLKSAINPGHVTVAVVQAASVAFDCKRTLQKALDLTRDAAKRRAKLVLFPEAFISGYPRGLSFGAVVGSTPITRAFGTSSLMAVETPALNPPPPTGTRTVSTLGRSAAISRPTVPCPAMIVG